jgi:hypothetical protein
VTDAPDGPSAPATPKRAYFVRSIFAGRDIEMFLVTAVGTILMVRAILAASGWPQLGGGKIHFAHLLWGGLGMLIALVLFMAMQGRLWKQLATLSAGIGFGLFIDELGKFVTSDNDYFFQPAMAFMYLVFVSLYLVARFVFSGADVSPQAALVNAFDLAKEAVARDLDETEQAQVLALLARCDQGDPVVMELTRMVAGDEARGATQDVYMRLKAGLRGLYGRLVMKRWFKGLVVAYLALLALGGILNVAIIGAAWYSPLLTPGFWEYGQIVSAIATGTLVAIGFVRWRRSRLAAYRWFERALLVSLFVGQFFAFYGSQTTQVFGLVLLLLTYATVRGMIAQEEAAEAARASGRVPPRGESVTAA